MVEKSGYEFRSDRRTGQQSAQMVLDRNDLRRDWGPSALNITSQSSISALYELPFGQRQALAEQRQRARKQTRHRLAVECNRTFLTGFPFTPLIGSNRSGDGDTRNPDGLPSILPSTGLSCSESEPMVQSERIHSAAPGTYGNLGRGTLTGPGLADVDLSLFKNTAVSEKASLQFRAEFFNLFNRSNFGPPNTTVFSGTAISPSAGLITTTATTPGRFNSG